MSNWTPAPNDPLDQAFALFKADQVDAALAAYRDILVADETNAEANHMIGVIAFQQGKNDIARDFMKRATEAPRDVTAEMFNNLGSATLSLNEYDEAAVAFEKAIALRPDYVDALNNLGVTHRNAKRIEKAIECLKRAVEINPNHAQAQANLRAAYRDVVPTWHFAMMDDKQRNDTYETAIKKAAPGKRVLDIGTGAGLLSLLSARAGATRVTGVEAVSVIAERAREIMQKNGYGSRVTVHAKTSQELIVGRDMPERADLLVTETFSSGLINESVLPTIEDAHDRLLTPNARVIPMAASALGYLAGGEILKGLLYVGQIKGFDLSPFDNFAPPNMQMSLDRFPHDVLSDDTELWRFNLQDKAFPMDSRKVMVPVTKAGTCLGVGQWIMLELDETTRYENRPAPDAPFNGHWTHIFYRFAQPIAVKPGDVVPLLVRHYRTQFTVELATD